MEKKNNFMILTDLKQNTILLEKIYSVIISQEII